MTSHQDLVYKDKQFLWLVGEIQNICHPGKIMEMKDNQDNQLRQKAEILIISL